MDLDILGVDPGSRATGWGVLRCRGGRVEAVEWGVVRPTASASFEDRLVQVKEGLVRVLADLSPQQAAVENPFQHRNAASALKLGQVRGVAVVALKERGLHVASYSPGTVKKAVSGHGNADKEQVARMVQRLLGLEAPPAPSDAADALAVALCHAHTAGLGTAGSSARGRTLKHPVRG